jgi:hypothetical protein
MIENRFLGSKAKSLPKILEDKDKQIAQIFLLVFYLTKAAGIPDL